jgi:endonuclease/exonuclease/phosphatase family metal-dependent hydrolase
MHFIVFLIALFVAGNLAADEEKFRVLSWNISADAFVAEPLEFRALLQWGDPDIVLLDEVAPTAGVSQLDKALKALNPDENTAWNINFGQSGGRQRNVIASRAQQETLPEFAAIVSYPQEGRQAVLAKVPEEKRSNVIRSMDDGIPVNGSVLLTGEKRLLVLITDLQCCGDGPDSWEEHRRRVEAAEIRRLIRQILKRSAVDGIVLAGDFNLVESTFGMTLLTGPYPAPHSALIPAELYHPDGKATWTWDGRDTPFPSDVLDYQFYGPSGLELRGGFILDTEKLSPEALEQNGLKKDMVGRTGRHRPLVAEYAWR